MSNDKMREALRGFLAIVRDSSGVAGYHMNGDIAEWDSFPEVAAAEEAIAAQPATVQDAHEKAIAALLDFAKTVGGEPCQCLCYGECSIRPALTEGSVRHQKKNQSGSRPIKPPASPKYKQQESHIAQTDNTGADSEAILQEAPELTRGELWPVIDLHVERLQRHAYEYGLISEGAIELGLQIARAAIAADRARRK